MVPVGEGAETHFSFCLLNIIDIMTMMRRMTIPTEKTKEIPKKSAAEEEPKTEEKKPDKETEEVIPSSSDRGRDAGNFEQSDLDA